MTDTMPMMKTCWILTDGSKGMINQCLGVAASLGLEFVQKKIKLKAPWKWLTPYFRLRVGEGLAKDSDSLKPPFPDMVISCGRQAILPALWIKQASDGRVKIVHIQNPKIDSKHFDALLIPQHDGVQGFNVIQTVGAPHLVSRQGMALEKEKFPEFAATDLNQKVIGILIGGPCGAYKLDVDSLAILTKNIKKWRAEGHKVLISPSRRTPPSVIDFLKKELDETIYLWDQQGDNPYFAILGHADALLVTCDSVCMITEASVTEAPVYLVPLVGGSRRFSLFHNELISRGRIQWWNDQIPLSFSRVGSFNENDKIAHQLKDLLGIQTPLLGRK